MDIILGFHARSLEEFKRLSALPYVSVLEVKPEKFDEHFYYDDGYAFELNEALLSELSHVSIDNEVDVHFHMPPDHWDKQVKGNLAHSAKDNYRRLKRLFNAYLDMNEKFGLGKSLTFHPPIFEKEGERICNVYYAMDKANKVYRAYDRIMTERGVSPTIGLENMLPPKKRGCNYVGHENYYFRNLLERTPFGLTYDTGHMKLNEHMSPDGFTRDYKVHTIHLHTNGGEFDEYSYNDDAHELATPFNLDQFDAVKRIVARDNPAVICEVSKLKDYSDEELNHYLWHLGANLRE